MRKALVFVLIFTVVMAGGALAAQGASPRPRRAVPGDVLVIFKNPFPDVPVTLESLARGSGAHAAFAESVAESLDAKVTRIYESLSVEGNEIMALLHTDSRSESTLWLELRMRPDVKGASLNYVERINVMRPRK